MSKIQKTTEGEASFRLKEDFENEDLDYNLLKKKLCNQEAQPCLVYLQERFERVGSEKDICRVHIDTF